MGVVEKKGGELLCLEVAFPSPLPELSSYCLFRMLCGFLAQLFLLLVHNISFNLSLRCVRGM